MITRFLELFNFEYVLIMLSLGVALGIALTVYSFFNKIMDGIWKLIKTVFRKIFFPNKIENNNNSHDEEADQESAKVETDSEKRSVK
jgi:ABC-type lipoprotein release transport system permease subunit